jgi:hemolysin III
LLGRRVYDTERLADIRLLAVALSVAATAAAVMIAEAVTRGNPMILTGSLCYGLCLVAVFAFSLLYRATIDPERRRFFRRLDHAAIFAMIAGSATPFALAQPSLRGLIVTAGLWGGAAAGIVFKLWMPIGSVRRSALFYVPLGWAALVAVGPAVTFGPALLIAVGGAFYSGGVPFLLWRELRFRIVIWHAFVLAGAACHYTAILCGVVLA